MNSLAKKTRWIAAGFVLGVFFAGAFQLVTPLFFVAIAPIVAVSAYHFRKEAMYILLLVVSLGSGVFYYRSMYPDNPYIGQYATQVTIEGRVSSLPTHVSHQTKFIVNGVDVMYAGNSDVEYGDVVRVTGKIDEPWYGDNGVVESSYVRGVLAQLKAKEVIVVSKPWHEPFYLKMSKFKDSVNQKFEAALGEYFGHAIAMLYGDKSGIEPDVKGLFTKLGISHVLVASGFNVAIFSVYFVWLRRYFGRRIYYAAIGLIVLYACFVGLDPSIVRASIMGIIMITSFLLGRLYNASHALLVVCALMVLHDPLLAAHSLSFQLSFLATLGIILCYSDLNSFMPKRFGLGSLVSVTLCAVVFTLPISLYYFGQFNLVALIANLIIVPVVFPLVLLSVLSLIPFFGVTFAKLYVLIFALMERILDFLSLHSYLLHFSIDYDTMLFCYAILALSVWFLKKSRGSGINKE